MKRKKPITRSVVLVTLCSLTAFGVHASEQSIELKDGRYLLIVARDYDSPLEAVITRNGTQTFLSVPKQGIADVPVTVEATTFRFTLGYEAVGDPEGWRRLAIFVGTADRSAGYSGFSSGMTYDPATVGMISKDAPYQSHFVMIPFQAFIENRDEQTHGRNPSDR